MFKIAICDVDRDATVSLEQFFLRHDARQEFRVSTFHSGSGLLRALKSRRTFDLIILSIELGKPDGLEIGRWLRMELGDTKTQLLFLSSSTTHAMSLFELQPLNFLIKPLEHRRLLDSVHLALKIESDCGDWFNFHVGHEHRQVRYKSLLYFESCNRKVHVVCRDEEHSFYGKLSELCANLPPMFLRVHQSYLINCAQIRNTDYRQVVMSNQQIIPVSQTYKKSLRRYLDAATTRLNA